MLYSIKLPYNFRVKTPFAPPTQGVLDPPMHVMLPYSIPHHATMHMIQLFAVYLDNAGNYSYRSSHDLFFRHGLENDAHDHNWINTLFEHKPFTDSAMTLCLHRLVSSTILL